ncbi:hypothetical protein HDU91_002615, partial [Kappamyces sp. JEL0680]
MISIKEIGSADDASSPLAIDVSETANENSPASAAYSVTSPGVSVVSVNYFGSASADEITSGSSNKDEYTALDPSDRIELAAFDAEDTDASKSLDKDEITEVSLPEKTIFLVKDKDT